MTSIRALSLSPSGRRSVRLVLIVAAVLGLAIGIEALVLHLTRDPLADLHAYYDAGARLNAGQPLYDQPATTDAADYYRYPPLLALAFRPLALLPFEGAAAIWMGLLVAATVATLWRLGVSEPVLLGAGMLAMPSMWTLAIGQAQALVTMLLAFGTPFGVALAGHLKLLPWLAAAFWVARRDWPSLRRFAGWWAALALAQIVLEPNGSVAFLSFPSLVQVGDVVNLSPYAVSPVLWAAFAVLAGLLAWRLAPGRFGWAATVAFSVVVSPRLLAYQLSTLIAGLGGPRVKRTP